MRAQLVPLDGGPPLDVAKEMTVIGRQEECDLRLDHKSVSKMHCVLVKTDGLLVLRDLGSTNGTRVNGTSVQIRRLRIGDRVGVGRSLLLFGSNEEIAARMASLAGLGQPAMPNVGTGSSMAALDSVDDKQTLAGQVDPNQEFDLNVSEPILLTNDALFIGTKALPPLPLKMTPSQAARLAEILDYFHQGLTQATENIQAKDDGTQVTLDYADWQRLLAIQMLLSRYLRLIADPPETEE